MRKLAARRLVVEFTPLTTRAYRWELQRKMERGPAYDDQFETVSDEIELRLRLRAVKSHRGES